MKKQFKMGTGLVWGMVVLGGFLTSGAEEKVLTIESSSSPVDSDPMAKVADTFGNTSQVENMEKASIIRVKNEVNSQSVS